MTQGPTRSQLAAWRAFLVAHARITERLEKELAEARGLPLTWYDVLVQLSEAPAERLRMHDLAHAVLLSRAGLTRLVDRMAGDGFVERVPCEDDRRGTFVVLTKAGKDALRAAAPTHLRGVAEHFTGLLDEAECAILTAALTRVAEALH